MIRLLPATTRKFKLPKWAVPALSYGVATASLVAVFRRFPFVQFGHDVQALGWGWVTLAIGLELLVYVVDAWRWQTLLSPAENPPLWACIQAVYIGLFGNDVLPAKAGEIIRCYLLTYWTDVPLSLALTSAAIERIMDGIWMVIGFFLVTADMNTIEPWLTRGAWLLGVAVLSLSLLFMFVLFRREHAHSYISERPWAAKFVHMLHEIHRLGNFRTLMAAFWISVLYLFLQVVAVWALFHAANFDFSMRAAGVVLIVIRLGTMIPNAPANIGSFQYFCAKALEWLNAERPDAKSFSLIVYVVLTVPPLIGGAIAVALTGLNIGDIHHHAHKAHTERFAPKEPDEASTP